MGHLPVFSHVLQKKVVLIIVVSIMMIIVATWDSIVSSRLGILNLSISFSSLLFVGKANDFFLDVFHFCGYSTITFKHNFDGSYCHAE